MITETVPNDPTAIRYNTPMFRSAPIHVAVNGTTAHNNMTDNADNSGAML